MNITQAIEIRKSRRSYTGTPIEASKISLLKSRIDEYNQKSGLTVRFMENGGAAFAGIRKSYGLFKGVRSLFIMKGPADDPDLKEKIGYYGELLVLEATALGLGTCWVGGTFDSSGIRKAPGEELVCVITVGNVPQDETLRERMLYKAIHRKTKSIGEMSEVIGEPPLWLKKGMKAVQKAPSTRNTQKVLFLYKAGILRASVPDTYRFDYVDLGIAKLHFELAAGGKFDLGNSARYYPAEGE
ncbi:nitroreductase family protein [Anaerovorax odorimutans]|uniref:Nitroreductase family protein n=2 Tax=Bacillati TaxID=1783272 RepID=A0ABT1RT53_9FIRM|nr:nitroreductase family protein [Anaerovorax odorimutans]MCQ4638391.1 nitroreductase family protein [Anaerovorax odorimutans]